MRAGFSPLWSVPIGLFLVVALWASGGFKPWQLPQDLVLIPWTIGSMYLVFATVYWRAK